MYTITITHIHACCFVAGTNGDTGIWRDSEGTMQYQLVMQLVSFAECALRSFPSKLSDSEDLRFSGRHFHLPERGQYHFMCVSV